MGPMYCRLMVVMSAVGKLKQTECLKTLAFNSYSSHEDLTSNTEQQLVLGANKINLVLHCKNMTSCSNFYWYGTVAATPAQTH